MPGASSDQTRLAAPLPPLQAAPRRLMSAAAPAGYYSARHLMGAGTGYYAAAGSRSLQSAPVARSLLGSYGGYGGSRRLSARGYGAYRRA